jgi:hypothetical protein
MNSLIPVLKVSEAKIITSMGALGKRLYPRMESSYRRRKLLESVKKESVKSEKLVESVKKESGNDSGNEEEEKEGRERKSSNSNTPTEDLAALADRPVPHEISEFPHEISAHEISAHEISAHEISASGWLDFRTLTHLRPLAFKTADTNWPNHNENAFW